MSRAFFYVEAERIAALGAVEALCGASTPTPTVFHSAAAAALLSGKIKVDDLLALTRGSEVLAVMQVLDLPANGQPRLSKLQGLSYQGTDEDLGDGVRRIPAAHLSRFQVHPQALLDFLRVDVSPPEGPAPSPEEDAIPLSPRPFDSRSRPQNLLLYGPPGTGKTFSLKGRALALIARGIPTGDTVADRADLDRLWRGALMRGQVAMCTFHQAYSYEEFVEGIRPGTGKNGIEYRIEDGIFKELALLALAEALPAVLTTASRKERVAAAKQALVRNDLPSKEAFEGKHQYVLVVDEINRANIARVMGELITLLEDDKRVGMGDPITVTLPTSKQRFAVPPNLHVIGTLNTADRSIALMDVALRRRFTFEELRPDAEPIRRHLQTSEEMKKLVLDIFATLNRRLLFLYDREHQIGHAYFMKASTPEALRDVMLRKVLPLVQEYFYGQWNRIALVLGHPMQARGQTPSRLGEHDPALLKITVMKEMEVIGFDHDDYADSFEAQVHPAFALEGTDRAWLVKALVSLLVVETDGVKRRARIEERAKQVLDSLAEPEGGTP